ncbi:M3 family metallopeptidase [Capnocytophaga canimorsus]|uniref:M3 family metallopeptidase n=1 Tax=Capnocytophaga canimorsus TaxID=28188 RepID=UPI0037D908AE
MTIKNIFSTPYDTAPFSQFGVTDYKPAIENAITESLAEIEQITNNSEMPTFENTIEALAFCGEKLDRLSSMFFNLNSAETSPLMQEQAQLISPILTDYTNDIRLNTALFQRIKVVYEQKETFSLSAEEQTLLENTYKSFTRNGANLPEEEKQKLREIDKKLAALSLHFGENVLAETQNYELLITDENDLKGLPKQVIEAAAQLAQERNKKGWIFTLDFPSYVPFLKYAKNRDLRKTLFLAYSSKGFHNNKHNNEKTVLEIVKLREQRAKLLGYNNYAHFVLEERMAQSPEKVNIFLKDLLQKALPAAKRELEDLKKYAFEKDGILDLQKWDTSYYGEKLKQERFEFDDEILKPFFRLENVVEGMFKIAHRLYGLHFTPTDAIDKYHPEVDTYLVTDDENNEVAVFYTDFHPRVGKRNGAWMTSFKNQYKRYGVNSRPHISIVCNFTRPTKSEPSLLNFNEVTTLFHEFGHALHGMLANTTYPNLSGTNVYWDFVELPSQIMENWCYEPEALALFAHHYKTNTLIPIDLVNKIKEAATFMEGMQTIRQLSFGLLDMAWHTYPSNEIKNVKSFENEAISAAEILPNIDEICTSTAFSHIFQGGYASGYYSYKWAEVLDADAFEFFSENGIFNRETADKFKEHILSKGGSEHPMTLYERFRGKKPSAEALLKRAGLI